MQAMELKFKTL